jgi:DNA-binding protein Fis
VIAPIGDKDIDIRKRSDKVLKHIFKKALSPDYQVTRADEITEPGMITSQVLRAVQDSDLVVADLTGHNPNVFYELAVRHAIEKPIIHVIEPRLSKIPFDVGGFRTIEFDLTNPDSIESAVEDLRKQASAGKWGETPVKLANIMRRTQTDSPQILLLKQAVEGISNVSARLASVEGSVNALKPLSFIWNEDIQDVASSYASVRSISQRNLLTRHIRLFTRR